MYLYCVRLVNTKSFGKTYLIPTWHNCEHVRNVFKIRGISKLAQIVVMTHSLIYLLNFENSGKKCLKY